MRAIILLPLALCGCRDAESARPAVERASSADGLVTGVSTEGARFVGSIVGLHDPESVRYDAEQDVYFVSNIAGFGSNKDGNGYILKVPPEDPSASVIFARAGVNGVVLHAPMGIALQGDTLWVTDIDVVRGLHRRTGAPVATVDFSARRPVRLNDIAVGPDGTLRVTDTGILMVYEGNVHTGPDRIFSVGPGRTVSVVAEGPRLRLPNGIAWDSAANRWIVASFHRFDGEVAAMGHADSSRLVVRDGPGMLDGVELLPDESILFSSWADSAIHVWRDGRDVRVIREVPEPADIGLDTRRGRVLIPLTILGQVQIWDLGPWYRGPLR